MRRFFLSLLGVAAIAVTAIAILPNLVSSDWMRAELGRQLSAATGSSIEFNGPVKLAAFPYLAVIAEDVTLSDEVKGVTAHFKEVAGSISLSSLWSDRLHVRQVSLDRPEIIVHEHQATTATPAPKQNRGTAATSDDALATIVAFLERSSIDTLSVTSGTLMRRGREGSNEAISNIELTLAASEIDDELSLSVSARIQQRNYGGTFTVTSLRSLLERRPADLTLTFEADPAPAPGLSEFKASGQVTLNANGSYQLRGGTVDVGDQSLTLDALFIPGERARLLADLEADRLDLTPFRKSNSPSSEPQPLTSTPAEPTNLRFLAGFDAEISVNAAAVILGDIAASDVSFSAALNDGQFTAELRHLAVDAGIVSAGIAADIRADEPTFRGRLSSEGLDVTEISALLGQSAPLSGMLTIDAAFAFRGLDEHAVRRSANLTGTIGLRDGTFSIPGVAKGFREVKAKRITGRIEDLKKPVRVTGDLQWRNKPVDVDLYIPVRDVLLAGSIGSAQIPLKLQLQMADAALSLDGKAAFPSGYAGKLNFSVADLSKFLTWLGQSGSGSVKQLAFRGVVDASPTTVSFENATLSVNGVKGAGNGTVQFSSPLKISTALTFGELDLERLAGAPSPQAQVKANGRSNADVPLDLSLLRSIDATIKLNAEKLGYGSVFAGPVATSLVIVDGVASLTIPESPFYGGHVSANLKADGSQSEPSLAVQASVAGASAAPLLTDMAGFKHLEGALQGQFDVTGGGGTTATLARSLRGTANVRFSDGAIRGIDIADVYNNLVRLMSSGFKQNVNKATTFTELGASFAIKGGVASTEDIRLVGPLVRMSGHGAADIARGTLNFRLDPRLVASLEGQGAEVSTDGIGVPIMVEGSFAEPRIYPDLSDFLKNPDAALATLKQFGLPTDKLRIDELLTGGGAGGSVKDLLGGTLDKTLKPGEKQLSIEEIIGGETQSGNDEITAEPAATEQTTLPDTVADEPAVEAERPAEQNDSPVGSLLQRLLR